MKNSALRFIPLGGVGTFGMNCAALEWGEEMVVVDAGIKIPQGNFPGVDLFLPDFTYILENRHRLKAIIATHGHDDHIGALPYLLKKVDVPVYGTAFTLALVRERLANVPETPGAPDLRQILFGSPFRVGEAAIEAVPVDHSIPDSASLIFRTPAGTVIHTGDFRIPGGIPGPALEPLRKAGREGVDLLVCDSTNADNPGVAPSESEVAGTLRDLFDKAPGRVFLVTFASHIMRISEAIHAAQASGRKVVLEGKRIVRNFEIAMRLGYLRIPEGCLSSLDSLDAGEKDRSVYILTGSQGEPFSALSRIARGEHSGIEVRAGDTVIFSSRMIPGNELAVGLMIDSLFRTGATVYYKDPPRVHVSGHGYAREIASMIDLTAPRNFVPVHGDYRNLVACAGLARTGGLAPESIHVLDSGDVLQICAGKASRPGTVPSGRTLVDGEMMAGLTDPVLGQRRRLAREGVVVVAFSLPAPGGQFREPVVHSLGVGVGSQGEEVDLEAAAEIRRVLEQGVWGKVPKENLEENLRTAVRGVYRRALDKRPTILTVVL
ncbi:MAG: ribonuclease J [Proteobacteria bacterium]|nr:ribonuclease J [Pseudomonadota bacterium]